MNFSRTSITTEEERNIIIGMIVDTKFLDQIKDIYRQDFFSLPYTRYVSLWCMEYYQKYSRAPFRDIRSLFESKKYSIYDDATVEMIDNFLGNLSRRFEEDFEHYNTKFSVDKALSFFKSRSLELLVDRINSAKISGDIEKAEAEIANFKRVEKLHHAGVNVWEDFEAHRRAFNSNTDLDDNIIVHFPGALGELIRPLRRQDFVSYFGPAKRGKSTWLQEIALEASLNKYNVLYYSCEMTEEQMLTRIQQRVLACLEPGSIIEEISMPSFDGNYENNGVIHVKKQQAHQMDEDTMIERIDFVNSLTKSRRFKLICTSSGSTKASDIKTSLDNMAHYENFIPDVICIDYADILAPERNNDKRNQIDETWTKLREISQDFNCLVVTGSHTNKSTFERDIKMGDASEDVRKMNHITLGVALNQNDDDKEKNMMRLAVIADRFRGFNAKREVAVLQCLDIGQCYIDSKFLHNSEKV